MSEKKHLYYFDYMRILAAFGVVFMHVAAQPLRGSINGEWQVLNVLTSLAFTAVPFFMMMSGYLLLSGERTADVSLLLKKRLPRLLVPLMFWTVMVVFYLMYRWQDYTLTGFVTRLLPALHQPAWIHFWYMYTLLALYVISPVLSVALRNLDRKGHLFVLGIIGLITLKAVLTAFFPDWSATYLNIDLLNKLTFFDGHLATFILGYYLGKSDRRIPNVALGLGALVLLAVITVGTAFASSAAGGYDPRFQTQSAGLEVLLAACLFLLFKQRANRSTKLLSWVPVVPLTYAIYFMHNILVGIMQEQHPTVTLADTLQMTAVNFIICYFVTKTAATVPVLCYAVTGLSFKEACRSCNWIYTFKRIFQKASA